MSEHAAYANAWEAAGDDVEHRTEQVVLGMCFDHPERIGVVRGILEPRHFTRADHQRIFRAICELHDTSTPIDPITVLHKVREYDGGNKIPASYIGAVWLAGDANAGIDSLAYTPIIHNLSEWCRILREHAAVRDVVHECKRTLADASVESPRTLIESAAARLDAIARQRTGDDVASAKTCMLDAMARAETVTATPEGILTGIAELDRLTGGLYAGELTVLAARPSVGKSAFATSTLNHIVLGRSDIGALLLSLEMPRNEIATRMICALARNDVSVALGKARDERGESIVFDPYDWQRQQEAAMRLAACHFWLDHAPGLTIRELDARITRVKGDFDRVRTQYAEPRRLAVVVVDYLQLMRGPGQGRTEMVTGISQGLKELAMKHEVAMLALAQLSRAIEQRDSKRPRLSDLRDSGSIEQDADNVWFLHQPENSPHAQFGDAEIHVRKQRNGSLGAAATKFYPSFTLWADQ